MFPLRVACVGLLLLTACASSNRATAPSREARATATQPVPAIPSYGFHPEDPVRVGWGDQGLLAYLELLRGPQGQRIAWRRVGPSRGLEVFEVTYDGLNAPVRLYLDPHHGGAIHAPSGFIIAGLTSREPLPPEEKPEVIEL
ncbi:fibril protein [Pyxidicoccus sp. 3LG]